MPWKERRYIVLLSSPDRQDHDQLKQHGQSIVASDSYTIQRCAPSEVRAWGTVAIMKILEGLKPAPYRTNRRRPRLTQGSPEECAENAIFTVK